MVQLEHMFFLIRQVNLKAQSKTAINAHFHIRILKGYLIINVLVTIDRSLYLTYISCALLFRARGHSVGLET